MNIWDELSAIGEAAPPGTWDGVPTNLSTRIGNMSLEIEKMTLGERGLWLQCESMKLEIAELTEKINRLRAHKEHLREQIACACNALTDSILCSGNDLETNLHWVRRLEKVEAEYLRLHERRTPMQK